MIYRRLSQLLTIFVVVLAGLVAGCDDTNVVTTLRSLQSSGDVSVVCVGPDGRGRHLSSCPDGRGENRMLALVTQTLTGEVAVIDLTLGADGEARGVLDVDPSTPGFNFLPVGAQPVDIVSTPDGEASFVAAAEVNKQGIYALPSSCAGPPRETDDGTAESARELALWPACSLPVAPGDMAIVIDPPGADGRVRASCDGAEPQEPPPAATRASCPADLRSAEPAGRTKLVVGLPDLGQVAVIDAQSLLDREPGSFDPCPVEYVLPLEVQLPSSSFAQSVPPDLASESCEPAEVRYEQQANFESRPAGMAVQGSTLYIADQSAPVIHQLDLSDICQPVERAPLLPVSFQAPERVVTTVKVAVSPVTTEGERFLYAVDELDQPGASVMVFDVSPGAGQRTPIVRPGASRMPLEPADRIAFDAAVQDVTFALRDLPIADPETGAVELGTLCDPDPSLPANRPAALHRLGAGPTTLRGIFGFALLTSGQIAVIDVEDFDAPCRRPVETNPANEADFRGCKNDPAEPFLANDGRPTVTDEVSCNVVQPHRLRSSRLVETSPDRGISSPSLRGFPQLRSTTGVLATDQSPEGLQNPQLLPVDYPDPAGGTLPAQVHVGTTLFEHSDDVSNQLATEPSIALRNALTLPLQAPRSYPREEEVSLTYEGAFTSTRVTGFIRDVGDGSASFVDTSGFFCRSGVRDREVLRQVGSERFGLEDDQLEAFTARHADYIQIVSDLLEEDDDYWREGNRGATCGGDGRLACEAAFGAGDEEALEPLRDLEVVRAFQDRLVVTPRGLRGERARATMELVDCCFPSAVRYAARAGRQWILRGSASGFRHQMTTQPAVGPDGEELLACVRDCDPLRQHLQGRAFEIASSNCDTDVAEAECAVGPADADQVACLYDHTQGPVVPGGPASECIFDGLTARFAVYRGLSPSQRGMQYVWQTSGGFRGLFVSLLPTSTAVLPQEVIALPNFGQLLVVDGGTLGLARIDLETLGLISPVFF